MAEKYTFNEHFIDINSYKKGFNELNALMAGSMQELQDYINVMNQLLKIEKQRQAEIRKSAKVLQNETLANEKALKGDTNALKENTDAMRKFAKESEESAKKQKQHNDTIKVAKGSINEIKEQIKQLTVEHNNLNLETEKGRKDAADYAAKISNLKNTVKGFNDAMRTTNSTMKVQAGSYTDLIQKNKKLVESIKNLNPALAQNAQKIKAVQAEINANTNKLKDYDEAMGRNFRNVGNYKSAFQDFGSTLTGVSFSAGGLAIAAAGLALAIGGGVVNALKASITTAMDFEYQMARVKAISNATDEQFTLLTKTARDLGATTEFTAVQAGQGLEYLAMAGFSVQDAIKTVPSVLNLATASQLDLGRSAEIVANIMAGFQLSANDAEMAIDILAKTSTTSSSGIEDIGEAMKYIAPVASTLSIPMEEVSAVVGVFADNALKGGDATRAFSTSILRLADPTKKQRLAADALGISLFDNAGQFKGLINLTSELERVTAKMTPEQRIATVASVAGAEATKNYLILMNSKKKVMESDIEVTKTGSDMLKTYTSNLKDSTGATQKMADIMRNTLKGRIDEFNSALDDLRISVGDELAPAMKRVVELGIEFIAWVKESLGNGGLKAFGEVIMNVVNDISHFIDTMNALYVVINDMEDVSTFFRANLAIMTFGLSEVGNGVSSLKDVFDFLTTSIRISLGVMTLGLSEVGTIMDKLGVKEKAFAIERKKNQNPYNKLPYAESLKALESDRQKFLSDYATLTGEDLEWAQGIINSEFDKLAGLGADKLLDMDKYDIEQKLKGFADIINNPALKSDLSLLEINDEDVSKSKKKVDEINEYLLDKLVKNIDLEREINFSMDSAETDQQIADFSKKLADSFGDITLTPNDIIDESVYLDSFNELLASLEERYNLRFRYNALITDEKARTLGFLSLEIEKEKERLELLKLAKAEAIEIAESQAKLNGLVAQQKEIQLNVNRVKAVEQGITNLFLQLENKRIDKITDVKKQERARYLLQLKQLALEIAFAKIRERLGDSNAKSEIEGNKNSLITTAIGGLGSLLGGFKGGGYTGLGHNFRDNTGDRVAGLVHENEYVVPTPILKNNVASQMVSSLEMFRKTKNEKHLLNIPTNQVSKALESKSISNQTIINNNFNAKEVAQELAKVLPKLDVQQTVNGIIVQQKVGNMTTEYLVNAKKGVVPKF